MCAMETTTPSPAKAAHKRRRRAWGRAYPRPGGPGYLVQFPDPSGRKTPTGRTAYITRSAETKAEAEALLKELRKASITGVLAAPEPEATEMTVVEAIDGHVQALRAKGGSDGTIELYGCSRKAIELQGLGGMRVADVKPTHIERYLAWRRTHFWRTRVRAGGKAKAEMVKGGEVSISTIARDRELLCAAFNRLVRMSLLSENPVSKVPKPRRKAGKRTVLSKPEIARLLDACGPYLRPVALTLAYTGARKGEVMRLTWADVCLETGTLALYRPKVSNFSRVPLHPVLRDELARMKEARGVAATDDAPVFLSRYGRPYRDFKCAWAVAVGKAGLAGKGVTPHCLRHAFAVHFLEGGAAVTDLQAVLGHSSLATTQIYAGMVDRRTRASVEALNFSS